MQFSKTIQRKKKIKILVYSKKKKKIVLQGRGKIETSG